MAKLSPQEKMIVDLLSDDEWHCLTKELFIKDDRARISALNKKGYVINGDKWCEGACGTKHYAKLKMRRLEGRPALNKYQIYHAMKQSETAPNLF